MFNCEQCGETSKSGEPSFQKVVAIRDREYKNKNQTEDGVVTTVTKGTEIAKEIKVCESCACG